MCTLQLILHPVFLAYRGQRPWALLNSQYWAALGIAEFGSKIQPFHQGKHITIVFIIIIINLLL